MKVVHELFDEGPFSWEPHIKAWTEAFEKLNVVLRRYFPNGIEARRQQRAAAKRVHTAYRQKKGKRW